MRLCVTQIFYSETNPLPLILNSLVIYSAILLRKTRFIFQPNFADRVSRSVDYSPLSRKGEKTKKNRNETKEKRKIVGVEGGREGRKRKKRKVVSRVAKVEKKFQVLNIARAPVNPRDLPRDELDDSVASCRVASQRSKRSVSRRNLLSRSLLQVTESRGSSLPRASPSFSPCLICDDAPPSNR